MSQKINFLYVFLSLSLLTSSTHAKTAHELKKGPTENVIIEDPGYGAANSIVTATSCAARQSLIAGLTWLAGAQAPYLNHKISKAYEHATQNPPTEAEEMAYLNEHPMPSGMRQQFDAILTPERQQMFAEGKWDELEQEGFTFFSKGEPATGFEVIDKYVPEFAAGIAAVHEDAPDWVIKAENPNKKNAPFCPDNKKITLIKDANGKVVRFGQNPLNGKLVTHPYGQPFFKLIRPNNFLRIHRRNDIQEEIDQHNLQIKLPKKYPFFADNQVMVVAEKMDPDNIKPMTRRQFNDLLHVVRKKGYRDIQKDAKGIPHNVVPQGEHVMILDTERFNQHMPTAWLAQEGELRLRMLYPEHAPYRFYEKDYYRYWEKKDFATAGLIAACGALAMQYIYNNVKLAFKADTFKRQLTASYEKRPHISLEEYARAIVHGNVHADVEDAIIKNIIEWHETEKKYLPSQAYKIRNKYMRRIQSLLS